MMEEVGRDREGKDRGEGREGKEEKVGEDSVRDEIWVERSSGRKGRRR
jgi:hypothetical protein